MESIALISVPEIKLVYLSRLKPSERPKISHSKDAYEMLLSAWDTDMIELQEQFKIILLNRCKRILGVFTVSKGGLTHTIADTRLILAAAILSGATDIMLAHNHPSGNLKPSRADEDLTCKIKQAAAYHDMKVIDHLIITSEGYYSFADEGLL